MTKSLQPTTDQIEQIQDALLKAFNLNTLRIMVQTRLGTELETIVTVHGRDLAAILYDLICWANDQPGGLHKLLSSAIQSMPDDSGRMALVSQLENLELDKISSTQEQSSDVIAEDKVAGDHIERDKFTTGDIQDSAVVVMGEGALVNIYQNVAPSVSEEHSDTQIPKTAIDLNELADLLLQSDTMQDADLRNDVVKTLPPEIAHTIQRRTALKPDVRNIVKACLNYENGLETLIKILDEEFEGKSTTVVELRSLVN